MSTPREFLILRGVCPTVNQVVGEQLPWDEQVAFIEKTPEVVRKLELFDELISFVEKYELAQRKYNNGELTDLQEVSVRHNHTIAAKDLLQRAKAAK